MIDTVEILGVRVHRITMGEALNEIARLVESGGEHYVVTVNPEFVMTARRWPGFRRVLNAADLSLPDGIGLVLASRFLGMPVPERVAGSDLVPRLAGIAAERGWGLFLLGAAPGVADRAADALRSRFPRLRIAGTFAGSPRPEHEGEILPLIQEAKPEILLVAYGAPAQEMWIARNLPRVHVPLAMGVGGVFDFLAGEKKRAPMWARRIGVEWLFRLAQEPRRWRRQLALPRFALLVAMEWMRRKH